MRVSLAVKERGAPAPLVREMSVLSGRTLEDTSLNMGHASSALYMQCNVVWCRGGGAEYCNVMCTAGVVVLASTALLLCLVLLLLALRLARRRRRQRAQSAADLPLIYRWHQQQ